MLEVDYYLILLTNVIIDYSDYRGEQTHAAVAEAHRPLGIICMILAVSEFKCG